MHLLDRSFDHALDDVLLRTDEENDDRNQGHEDGGHHQVIRRDKRAGEIADRKRDGLDRRPFTQDKHGEQEVVPDPNPVEDQDGDIDRFQDGQDDEEEGLHLSATIDIGGFFDVQGDRFHEPVEHEDRQRTPETDIGDDDPEITAQHRDTRPLLEGPEPLYQREHDDLERNDHRGHEHHENREGSLRFRTHEDPRAHRGENRDAGEREERDDDRAIQGLTVPDVRIGPDIGDVLPDRPPVLGQTKGSIENLRIGFIRIDENQDKRHHEEDHQHDRKGFQ